MLPRRLSPRYLVHSSRSMFAIKQTKDSIDEKREDQSTISGREASVAVRAMEQVMEDHGLLLGLGEVVP